MASKFPLLEQLEKIENGEINASPLPLGIKYETCIVDVEGQKTKVFVPVREAAAFRQSILEHTSRLDTAGMRNLLRKHRGIRDWNKE